MFSPLELKLPLHERIAPKWGAQNEEALLVRAKRPVACPDYSVGVTLHVGDSWRLLPSSIPYTGLATVELNTGMSPQGGAECIVQWAYPVWAGDDIRVVEEREEGLSVTQLGLDLAEGGLLCQDQTAPEFLVKDLSDCKKIR